MLADVVAGVRARDARVVVVGGGIAGLAAAHRLVEHAQRRRAARRDPARGSGQLGGSVGTERTGGFVARARRGLVHHREAVGRWRSASVSASPIASSARATGERRTLVVHDGRLHPLPEGFLLMAPTALWPVATSPLFSVAGKLRMALDLVLPRRGDARDESLAAFVRRRLGREALERVAEPLVGGIYTADPERLSLAATMPRFVEIERRHRSIDPRAPRRRPRSRAAAAGRATGCSSRRPTAWAALVDALGAAPAGGRRSGCARRSSWWPAMATAGA